MRIEVRFKRNAYEGFNDALWFMGNNNLPWPANGEIDLLENPKRKLNNRAHFTLHSEKDRKSTRLNSSHLDLSRMPSCA